MYFGLSLQFLLLFNISFSLIIKVWQVLEVLFLITLRVWRLCYRHVILATDHRFKKQIEDLLISLISFKKCVILLIIIIILPWFPKYVL